MRLSPRPAVLRSAVALVLLLGLAACADTPVERNLAKLTSTQLVLHQTQVKVFIADQAMLNADDARELDDFAQATASVQDNSSRLTGAWTLAHRGDLLEQQATLTAVGAAAIIASMNSDATKPAALTDSGAGDALSGANKTLLIMATKASPGAQMSDMMASATAIDGALVSIQKSAASAGKTPPKPAAGAAPKPAAAPAK